MSDDAIDRQRVERALEDILNWAEIARSPQLANFLNYVVTRTLDGEVAGIKAYAIAVDVLGRGPEFDPQTDPIVRVQARRLRALLELYYSGDGANAEVQIHLPVGRYVPHFSAAAARALPAVAAEAPRVPGPGWGGVGRSWIGLAALVAGISTLAALLLVLTASRGGMTLGGLQQPSVTVFEFQNMTGDANRLPLAAGLAIKLVTDLGQFENLTVKYAALNALTGSGRQLPNTDFAITGYVRAVDDRVQYSAVLTDGRAGSIVWSKQITVPAGEVAPTLDSISRTLSLYLGSSRGPLHAAGYAWLSKQTLPNFPRSPYVCQLLFHQFRDSGRRADRLMASTCFEALTEREKASANNLAAMGTLLAAAGTPEGPARDEALARARADLGKAMHLSPLSGFIWEQQARFLESQGDAEGARAAYASAVQLNPANTDALAGFAQLLALRGNLQDAAAMSDVAVLGSPKPPSWYYCVPALIAMNDSKFAVAMDNAALCGEGDPELGPVLGLLGAAGSGNSEAVSRFMPQILDAPTFRANGIIPALRARISDRALLEKIGSGLREAAVPALSLAAPF